MHLQEPAVRPGTFQFAASPKRVAQVRQIPETAAEAHRAALLVQVRARRGQALRSGRTDRASPDLACLTLSTGAACASWGTEKVL